MSALVRSQQSTLCPKLAPPPSCARWGDPLDVRGDHSDNGSFGPMGSPENRAEPAAYGIGHAAPDGGCER